MNANSLTVDIIRRKLNDQSSLPPHNHFPPGFLSGPPRPAAVLIPFIRQNNQWRILFIRRNDIDGDRHSGQVAFPGGAQEQLDPSLQDAALREAQEEIGLNPKDVQILGNLRDFITISNFQVTPFVGLIPWPYELNPSPAEVKKIFTIPLDWLADSNNLEETWRDLPDNQRISVAYFQEFDSEILWGASARFTLDLLATLGLR